MDLCHGFDQLFGAADIAKTPAGHGIALTHAVDHKGLMVHLRDICHGIVLLTVCKLSIDLIGNDNDAPFLQNGNQRLQVLLFHDTAGGIGGIRKNQRLGAVCHGRYKLLRAEPEFVVCHQMNGNRYAGSQLHHGAIAYKTGFRDQNLIPGIYKTANGTVNALTAAHGDKHLIVRMIIQVKTAF